MPSIRTESAAGTETVGALLAPLLRAGDFIALTGDLGAGKTCFVRGIAAGLGVDPGICVTSPTYTLMNIYQGRLPLYHFDLYRLSGGDLAELGFDEYFYGNGVSVVEWAERMDDLPDERLVISFSHEGESVRRLDFVAHGERLAMVAERMSDSLHSIKKPFDPFHIS